MADIDFGQQVLHQVFGQWQCIGIACFECCSAFFAYQRVGVFAIGQEQKAQFATGLCLGQGVVERTPSRSTTSAIAIEAKDDFASDTKCALEMFGSGGRAQRGHRIGDTRLMQAHYVHIALDHQQTADGGAALTNFIQAVQLAAFVKQRSLGRVEVLGFALIDDAAAKGQHTAARVADGEHQAVTKTVIPAFAATPRFIAAAIALDDQAHLCQTLARTVAGGKVAQQIVPRGRRIADAKALQ